MKVFMGGTCNESKWREYLIESTDDNIDYFNPVVDDWTPDCQAEELRQRELSDICLYVITPRMTGVYSIAEAIDDSNKNPSKTVFCISNLDRDKEGNIIEFDNAQLKSLRAVGKMVERNGGCSFDNLSDLEKSLNDMQVNNGI